MPPGSPFWAKASRGAVLVEADAFKEKDAIYKGLMAQEGGADMAQISQLVHEASTQAASSALVTALNAGRDVIFDGTMSWPPFVMQTIGMARRVHTCRFRLGDGYVGEGKEERYWEEVGGEGRVEGRLAYRIEMVGVVCDAHLAVMRGMRYEVAVPQATRTRGHVKCADLCTEFMNLY